MFKTYIIAEAGINHNVSLDIYKKLVDVAVESCADAVKFQIFKTGNIVTENAEKAKYQEVTTGNDSQFQMLLSLDNISFKRPGTGISPACLNEILGKRVLSKVKKDEIILLEKLSR